MDRRARSKRTSPLLFAVRLSSPLSFPFPLTSPLTSTPALPMPTPSPPPSSDEEGDHEYIEIQDSEPEQPNIRLPTTSLASRFKTLCKASPPPSQSTPTVSAPPPHRRIVKANLTNIRSSVRSCDQCRSAKQRVSGLFLLLSSPLSR